MWYNTSRYNYSKQKPFILATNADDGVLLSEGVLMIYGNLYKYKTTETIYIGYIHKMYDILKHNNPNICNYEDISANEIVAAYIQEFNDSDDLDDLNEWRIKQCKS